MRQKPLAALLIAALCAARGSGTVTAALPGKPLGKGRSANPRISERSSSWSCCATPLIRTDTPAAGPGSSHPLPHPYATPHTAVGSITDVRLSGSVAGRLEAQDSNGQWWDAVELCVPSGADAGGASSSRQLAQLESALANVACRQLGFPGGQPLAAYTPSIQEPPPGPVLSALLICSGNETSVDQASRLGVVGNLSRQRANALGGLPAVYGASWPAGGLQPWSQPFMQPFLFPLQCDLVESECTQEEAPEGGDDFIPQPDVEKTVVAIVCAGELAATVGWAG